jgi:hypothetical protein
MSLLTENLKRRIPSFVVSVPVQTDAKMWLENQLLSSPFALTTISKLSIQTTILNGQEKKVRIFVTYLDEIHSDMVFGVKDMFELITAV